MNSRSKLLLACVVFILLVGVSLGGPAAALAGPTKGTGGWYWPTGTEKLGSMDGYWVFRPANHCWHLAKDISTPQGHPVYAIADGVVAESQADAGYGGVLVVWHTTGQGQKFLTIYGHIIRKNLKKGDHVTGGQIVGTINSANHLHFGIHPGNAYPPDGNPYRGHTYTSSNTYGFVDPIKFLQTHPAYLPYTAPALPLVTAVSTGATPTVLGTAGGRVYWRVTSGDDSSTVFAHVLPSGETTQVAEDATMPALDTTRYLATVSATGFKLYDRQPVLTAAFSCANPAWAHPVTITGALKSSAGKAFSGATVCLERVSGGSCVTVARCVSGPTGAYSLSFAPSRSYTLRMKFTPAKTFVATATAGVYVAPKPGVHAPDSAKQAKAGASVTISGALDARHTAGAHTVTLCIQKSGPSGWTTMYTTWATNANAGKTSSRYSRSVKLAAGSWRVRASCKADSLHAAETSSWTGFTVK